MKKILPLLLLAFATIWSFEADATHVAGAEITYEHRPTSNDANRYLITLTVYKDAFGIGGQPLPNTQSVCFSSSCNDFNQTLTCTNHPYFYKLNPLTGDTLAVGCGDDVPEQSDCAQPQATNVSGALFEVYTYQDFVTLSPCQDWVMQWDLCCRNGAITNGFANNGFSISSQLNNTIGPNSSPQFLKPGIKRFCVVNLNDPNAKAFNWDHPAIEADGDSIYYRFDTPKQPSFGAGNCGESDLTFSAPNTVTDPMPTHNGFAIDTKFGFFTFMPSLAGVYVVGITAEEWRFNLQTLDYERVGIVRRDLQIPVDGSCRIEVEDGPRPVTNQFGFTETNIPRDSMMNLLDTAFGGTLPYKVGNDSTNINPTVYQVPVIPYQCGQKEVLVRFPLEEPVFCPTVDPTDFRLLGPDGVARPIFEVETGCTPILRESSIMKLKLFQSLDVNGIYMLQIKRGNDGNTLQNKCGYEVTDNFFMILKVDDCKDLVYEISNVTVDNDQRTKVEYSIDTNTFISNAFERIDVLRANQGDPVQYLTSITDINAREFFDSNTNAEAVDQQAYVYILQMITNGRARVSTNFVNSILLEGDVNDEQTRVDLTWNDYENTTYGAPAEFEVFVSDLDTTGAGPTWESVQIVGRDMQYTYNIPENEIKWLKVEAQDPADSNLLISESNWIVVGSTTPPPPPTLTPAVTYVPNVITPNNDGISDRLYFSIFPQDPSLRPYSDMSLSIFNRWGKQVFQDNNYMQRNTRTDGWDGTDQNTGAELAEGVYFYVAKFSDDATGMKEELNGSITLGNSGIK